MRILASALCDDAVVRPDGKLDVSGVIHDLYAPGFPARQNRLTLVVVLEWDRTDTGPQEFRVDVRGPGGRTTMTVKGESQVIPRPPARPPPRMRLVLPLKDVVFHAPGRHRFDVTARGRRLRGPTLYLVETETDDALEKGADESIPATPGT